jgi:hypothetical protein
MPAVLHDDPLQRMSLTGSAIKRGTAAFQKHLGALGAMMERALASSDQLEDMQCPMQPDAGPIEFSIQVKNDAGNLAISKISGRILLCIFLC